MMKKVIRILPFLIVVSVLCSVNMTVFAADELPDLNRRGTITVSVLDTESKQPVSGGSLTLYQVAAATVDDWNFSLEYTKEFAGCTVELGDLQSEELADELASYVRDHNIDGVDVPVSDGKAVFSNQGQGLELGLYLIMQNSPADGYSKLNPFLITIPRRDGDHLTYDVDAWPKAGTVDSIPQSDEPNKPTKPAASKLPQTGMLWWPVPILAVCGMLCFLIGWMKRQRNGE